MSSKRRLRRKSCEGKIRYESQDEAGRHAGAATHQYGVYLHAYHCPHCGGYHIGKPIEEVRRALKARGVSLA